MTRDTLTGTQSGLWAPSLSWEGMGGQSQRERGRRYPPQQTHLLKMGTALGAPAHSRRESTAQQRTPEAPGTRDGAGQPQAETARPGHAEMGGGHPA